MDTTGERVWEPELYRLKGALLLQQHTDNQAEAETCFQHAISIARSQQAKFFELKTATSLARLWQQQGKRRKPMTSWTGVRVVHRGLCTADLQDAKALLNELGA